MSPGARLLGGLLGLYQRVMAARPSPCRYVPSCSSYALEAVEVHGALKGSWLMVRRLARCHPWGGYGWDPVPPNAFAGTLDSSDSNREPRCST